MGPLSITAVLVAAATLLTACRDSPDDQHADAAATPEPASALGATSPDVTQEQGGPDTTASIGTTTVPTTAEFSSRIEPVTEAQLGSSWKAWHGCPAPSELRLVTLSYWGYDGVTHHDGRLVVAAAQADRVVAALAEVFEARFPIERMVPIDAYGGDDQASMRANNTSAFNCRHVAGTTRLSEHALGQAIDINPLVNPYIKGGSVDPPEGAAWADRTRTDQGMIRPDDAVVRAFAAQGWSWGGYWRSGQDLQHFSAGGR